MISLGIINKGNEMKKITILLAEDHVIVRESIRQSLEKVENFEVIGEAGDGEEAAAMVEKLHPNIVIMDISMPKLNGIEATKKIKEKHPGTIILVLTAYDYEQYIFPLLEAGAAGYLLKDVSSSELINAIQTVYRGEAVLHPAIARKVMERFKHNTDEPVREKDLDMLTEREMTIIKLAAQGKSNVQMADELKLSVRTIESHLGAIFNKLGVGSRTEAVIKSMKKVWLKLEELT
jgi:NarL family two-component system response regulator LiaR